MHIYKICTLFSFYEELVKFLLVQRYYLLDGFVFYDKIYSLVLFDNLVQALFWLFGLKWVVKNESVIFLSKNSIFEIL